MPIAFSDILSGLFPWPHPGLQHPAVEHPDDLHVLTHPQVPHPEPQHHHHPATAQQKPAGTLPCQR